MIKINVLVKKHYFIYKILFVTLPSYRTGHAEKQFISFSVGTVVSFPDFVHPV